MIRINYKIFTTYIILACFFIVIDLLALLSAEDNRIKEFIIADVIVLIPIIFLGALYCKRDISDFKFKVLMGIDSIVFW